LIVDTVFADRFAAQAAAAKDRPAETG